MKAAEDGEGRVVAVAAAAAAAGQTKSQPGPVKSPTRSFSAPPPSLLASGGGGGGGGEQHQHQQQLLVNATTNGGRLAISVLSYNLNLLPKGVNPVGHRYKSARLAEFVSKCLGEYDVMALQEVFSTPYLPAGFGCRQAHLVALAARHGYSAVRGRQPSLLDMLTLNRTTDSGLLILSKYPVLKSGSYTFTHRGAHMDAGAAKGVIFALIKVGHANVLVFNTHLQATHSSSSHSAARASSHGRGGANYESIRYRQILELKNFINKQRHVNGRDVPWLLTGDFNIDAISRPAVADEYGYVYDNTSIESEEYKKLVSLLDPAGRMRDLLKECNNGEHPATRPPRLEFPSSVDLVFKHKYPQRLDYIFWSSPEGETGLAVPKSRLDHTQVVPFVVTGMEFSHLSDHYGIQTTLEYRGIKDDEDAILFSTEKAFSDIFNDKQTPAPSKWFMKGWKVLALVAASVWILTWIYPHCPLEVFVQVALFMGAYLVYKLYKLVDKLLRKKPFKHDIEPGQQVMKSIIGKYDVIKKEGPLHRSPHSPHRLLDLADGASTLYDNFSNAVRQHGYRPCMGTRARNGDGSRGPYAWLTYDEVWTRVSHFGSGLLNLGYKKGDLVGIFSENRVEWVVTEQACNAYSLVCVPVYDAGDGCLQYILNHARLTVVIASRPKTFKAPPPPMPRSALLDMSSACPDLRVIIQMEPIEYEESYAADQCNIRLIPYNFVEKDGLRRPQPHVPPEADDLATLAYDMSTQGKIKGVMLSHRNLLSSSRALVYQGRSRLPLTCEDVHISYIPLHMRIERSVLALLFSVGASLGFSQEDGSKIFDDIQVLRPTLLFGVPGMFIRLYRKCKVIVSSWWGPRQALFHYAYKRKQRAHRKRRDTPFWNKVLFRKFAARLGGRVRLISILSDGLLPLVHKEFLQICFCCWVTESYWKGTVGVVTGSSMYSFAEDEQAGYPLPCNEIKLVDIPQQGFSSRGTPERGRIKIRGHNVFVGYYGDPKLTDAKIDSEGWLTTNDIGQWNPNGTLTVLGHEQGILQPIKGQIVFNKYLEYLYLESYFVQQIFVTCLPFRPLVAVVVPDHEVLCWWAKENNLQHDFRPETLCRDPRVREAVLKDLEAVADQHKNLSAWEYVKAVHLEPSFFNVENQCITPTFTLRRQHLRTRFSEQIMEMYRELSADIHDVAHHNHHHHNGADGNGAGSDDGDERDDNSLPQLRSSQLTLPTYTDTKKTPYLPTYQKDSTTTSPALDPLRRASSDRGLAESGNSHTNAAFVGAEGSAPSTLLLGGDYCVCGGVSGGAPVSTNDSVSGGIRPLRSSTHPRGHYRTPSLTVTSSASSSLNDAAPEIKSLSSSSSASPSMRRSHSGMPSSLSSPSLSSLEMAAFLAAGSASAPCCPVCRRRVRPRSLPAAPVSTSTTPRSFWSLSSSSSSTSATADDKDDQDQLMVAGGNLLLPINSSQIDTDSDSDDPDGDARNHDRLDDDDDDGDDSGSGSASDNEVVRTLC